MEESCVDHPNEIGRIMKTKITRLKQILDFIYGK